MSIIEVVYNVFKKQWSFALSVWFWLTPPTVMVKYHMFTIFLGGNPSLMYFDVDVLQSIPP